MVNRYCIMYKYNSINHTNEKTEAFYCLKNNYDKEKTKYYNSSLSDNHIPIQIHPERFFFSISTWTHFKMFLEYFTEIFTITKASHFCHF